MEKNIINVYEELGGDLTRDRSVSQMVLCIVHADSNPSMKLDVDDNTAYCFSCRKSWTPEKLIKELSGVEEEQVSSKKTKTNIVMVDAFEREILHEIKSHNLSAINYIKIFEALDLARESDSVEYQQMDKLMKLVRKKFEVDR